MQVEFEEKAAVNGHLLSHQDNIERSSTIDDEIEAFLNRPRPNFSRLGRAKQLAMGQQYANYHKSIMKDSFVHCYFVYCCFYVTAPEFVKRLEPFAEVFVGESVVLECQVSSFPTASIKVRCSLQITKTKRKTSAQKFMFVVVHGR